MILELDFIADCFHFYTDKGTRSAEKRIVLHSSTDVLHVISNLTGQLASLAGEFESLKKEHSRQIHELQSNLTDMKNENSNQKSLIQSLLKKSSSGSIYVPWGKNSCPGNGTENVYTGFAAGSFYSSQGGGANHLCLSPDPVWAHYTNAEDSGASIYGTEYQFWNHRNNLTPFLGQSLLDKDVPCSVCRTTRSSVIIIAGRNICYAGWTLEYKGYLVAGIHGTSSPSEYICLDDRPDVEFGGQSDQDGALLNFVEAKCGSLKCPPYENNRELTCAVCSK